MRMTFALAALFAATAITPALAQDNGGRGDRGDRGGARAERGMGAERGAGQGGGWRQGGGERPQGGWQRGPQAAPQAAPAPQPQVQQQAQPRPERQWNGNRGGWNGNAGGGGGVAAQPNWGRGQQDGQRNWRRDDGPRGQMGGTPVAPPPAVVNRDDRRFDGNRGERGGWSGTFGANNGRAWQQNQNRNDGWRDRDRPRDDGNRWNNGNRPDNRNWNGNRGGNWNGNNGWNGNRNWNGNAWNRDWRRNQQYDWQRYRYSNRNLFRANPYYAPRGWGYGYQRFSIGIVLNNLLWDQQYWIEDPNDYRLPPAYGPYRWVRYYDDVLLVDIRNGQVVDVINDFFW